jgi:SAM-dependent methyltransferase
MGGNVAATGRAGRCPAERAIARDAVGIAGLGAVSGRGTAATSTPGEISWVTHGRGADMQERGAEMQGTGSETEGDYRGFVGPSDRYDLSAASQFNLLTFLGLREQHELLDIGCGSLRGGKLFIPYLRPGHYCGIEPEPWLVREGIEQELGDDLIAIKRPSFLHDSDFTLTHFGRQFDFLLAQSIFSHTTQAQMRRCLSQAKEVLKPEGVFAATYFQGEEDYTGEEWVYPGAVYFRFETLLRMAGEVGLACCRLPWDHTDGQSWVAFTHPGRDVELRSPGTEGGRIKAERLLGECRTELVACRSQLDALERHPYVRLGRGLWHSIKSLVGG